MYIRYVLLNSTYLLTYLVYDVINVTLLTNNSRTTKFFVICSVFDLSNLIIYKTNLK